MVLSDRRQTSTGKASGSGRRARLTRNLWGSDGRQENDKQAKAQQGNGRPDLGEFFADDNDGDAKLDQHGRSRRDVRCGSADPPGR
jgi:hypothetical protein